MKKQWIFQMLSIVDKKNAGYIFIFYNICFNTKLYASNQDKKARKSNFLVQQVSSEITLSQKNFRKLNLSHYLNLS